MSLIFTESAASKVWELIQEEGNPNLKLRVYVTGGGCSGFQYGFTFSEAKEEDDKVFVGKATNDVDVELLVDSLSFQYLKGAKIIYQEDLQGERFVIVNPNAKTTCGCGSSFSAE
ncbi:MAG TPA: iron-sulfur cluster insertion protein ErpA [Gammaproteobacteria bacterium]|jgi:iron-sulfur cluster insertion protein|nr:iron-sulfur cluster insertion protein ErpA [Gammaproteobacteria bacterium]